MTRSYSIGEARAKLPTIVDEVQAGGEVELTKRGRPVAVVVSPQLYERLRAERPTFKAMYERFLARHNLAEIGIEPGEFDDLRDRTLGRDVQL